jgi:hypothetical protein
MFRKSPKGFPSVITLFSAPNYLDAYNNKVGLALGSLLTAERRAPCSAMRITS